MPGGFHTYFNFYRKHRLIGVFFLFLCCVFIATPLVSVAGTVEKISCTAAPLSQHQAHDSEESIRTSDAQHVYLFSLRLKQKATRFQRNSGDHSSFILTDENEACSYQPNSGPVRPAYYIFLFMYTLF